MNFKKHFAVLLLLTSTQVFSVIPDSQVVNDFINLMVSKHHFELGYVRDILQQAEIKPAILQAISKPAEAMPWYKYRPIFMTDKRIAGGVKFWQDNAVALASASAQYGVPAEIIVAIIGVETQYGANVGKHRVLDALATLGFAYPKRSPFFLSELENFLLLCREEGLNPLLPLGSYAGAMGYPQFMPSSYRNFAMDFEQDKHRDIWKNPADAIVSVANYFAKHHWETNEHIFFPAVAEGIEYKAALHDILEPDLTAADLQRLKIKPMGLVKPGSKMKLLALQLEQGEELWLGLHNFYVITRYNRSPLYAMAVYQLSQAIANKKNKV